MHIWWSLSLLLNLLSFIVLHFQSLFFTLVLSLFRVYWQTNRVAQSPFREADSSSVSPEIPLVLWNLKFHYRVHKSPPLVPFLIQTNPVRHISTFSFNMHFSIIQSTFRSSRWSVLFTFTYENPVHISLLSRYYPRALSWFDHCKAARELCVCVQ